MGLPVGCFDYSDFVRDTGVLPCKSDPDLEDPEIRTPGKDVQDHVHVYKRRRRGRVLGL